MKGLQVKLERGEVAGVEDLKSVLGEYVEEEGGRER